MTDASKAEIRRAMRQRKAMLSEAERRSEAEAVFAAVERTALFAAARRVMIYSSLPDELPTDSFINRWAARKQLFLPRVNGEELDVLPYRPGRLSRGAFNIDEPDGDDTVDPATLDLIIVPAVALDPAGNRLGRGKGFYDRLLRRTSAATIGVGFACQLLPDLPAEPHDVPLDLVITPAST